MPTTDEEMIRKHPEKSDREERFTSLQPTYEDSVPPEEDEWDDDGSR